MNEILLIVFNKNSQTFIHKPYKYFSLIEGIFSTLQLLLVQCCVKTHLKIILIARALKLKLE